VREGLEWFGGMAPAQGTRTRDTGVSGLAESTLQPFSQKSRTPTVAKEFQIGLYDPAEADLELFCNSWRAGFLGEQLYVQWGSYDSAGVAF